MGSGLDYWIYWLFLALTINYESSQSLTARTRSIPYWTTSVFTSTCDEQRITAHTLNCLERRLSSESLLRMNYESLITSMRPEYRSPSQKVPLLFSHCHGNVFVNIRCHGNLCLGTYYVTTDAPLLTASLRECVY
jgi:hypothetical protein